MRRAYRIAGRIAAGLAALVLITGLAAAEDPLRIRIGWSTMPGHMIPVLYGKPEILKHYGRSYTVEPILFRGSSPQITAMAARQIDMAAFAPLAMTLAVTNARLDVKAVADIIQDGVPGHHSETFLVAKDSGIDAVQDLKGKRIGMNAIGSAADTAMKTMFRKNGLSDRDYSVVEVSFPNIPIMLEEKKIDMGPVLQPFLDEYLATGRYRALFRAKEALGGPVQFVFLAGRTEFLEKNREKLLDFFEDHVRAMRWFADPKNHDEAVRIVADFMKQKPENLAYIFTDHDYFRDPFLYPNVKGIQSMVDVSHEVGLAPTRIEVAPKYVDMSFVEEARRRIEADGGAKH